MLQEADMGLTSLALDENNSRFTGDDRLLVKFFMHPKQDHKKSVSEGRPIFIDTPYIHIMVPGDKESIIIRPCTEQDKKRFPRQLAAFENDEEDIVEGTPLDAWPGITRSQVEELKFFNVRTVEQLAHMSDSNAQKFMGVNLLRRRALAFLEASEGNAAAEGLAAELEERDNEIAALKEAVADLQAKAAEDD